MSQSVKRAIQLVHNYLIYAILLQIYEYYSITKLLFTVFFKYLILKESILKKANAAKMSSPH